MVSYRWSLETIPLSYLVAETLCVERLCKHIFLENALIPILGLWAKQGLLHFQF